MGLSGAADPAGRVLARGETGADGVFRMVLPDPDASRKDTVYALYGGWLFGWACIALAGAAIGTVAAPERALGPLRRVLGAPEAAAGGHAGATATATAEAAGLAEASDNGGVSQGAGGAGAPLRALSDGDSAPSTLLEDKERVVVRGSAAVRPGGGGKGWAARGAGAGGGGGAGGGSSQGGGDAEERGADEAHHPREDAPLLSRR